MKGLILQGDDGLSVTAEGSHFLQITVGSGQDYHGPVAVNGMAGGGEIPASAFGMLLEVTRGLAKWLCWLGSRETKQQG